MSFLALAMSAIALGFAHGLGADHLMAIAALAIDGKPGPVRARAIQTAFGFAVGHTVVVGLGAAAAIVFGIMLPAAFEAGAERVGGVLLVVLGAAGLWSVVSGRAYSHVHSESDGRVRWHLHFAGPNGHPRGVHQHSRLPALVGAAFAISSIRALVLLQPLDHAIKLLALPAVLLLVALFGLGILISMSLFGVVLSRVLSLRAIEALGRAGAVTVAAASILLGIYWIVA
jgi:nickel/cobalt transporter (NicO) family protein